MTSIPTPLTFTHLRFQARARTAIRLGEYQGAERLRDALAQVMLRAVCPDPSTALRQAQGGSSGRRAETPSPEHAAVCPACWLLAAQTDPGAVRRLQSRGCNRRWIRSRKSTVPVHHHLVWERFRFLLTLCWPRLRW